MILDQNVKNSRNFFYTALCFGIPLLLPFQGVQAGTCAGSAGIYVCSGAAGADTTQNLADSALVVTTNRGFGISTTSGDAIHLEALADSRITFTDDNASTITGWVHGISAINTPYTIQSDILIITTGTVTGNAHGISVANWGMGATSITSTGTVIGSGEAAGFFGYGIKVDNRGTNVTVHAADAFGGQDGINVFNHGAGSVSVTTTGTVIGALGNGISIENSMASTMLGTGITIHAADVSGGFGGISAANSGNGILSITITGTVTGNYGRGIYAFNRGPGATSIMIMGTVIGGEGAIYARSFSGEEDLYARNSGGAPISITNTGVIRNLSELSSDQAIRVEGGASTISNRGRMTGTVWLLSRLGNSFTNELSGTWDTAGGTNEFGALAADNIVVNKGTIIAANGTSADAVQTTLFNDLGTFDNSGTLTMQNGVAGDTTRISGAYVSNGGALRVDTALEGDDSLSDRLVTGSVILGSGGATRIYVSNAGGLGALTTGNGIELVHVDGGASASAAGAFTLASPVKAGAYAYTLFQNGLSGSDGNWYLRSTFEETPPGPTPEPTPTPQPVIPNYRVEVPVYMASPALASRFGLSMLGSCDERASAYAGSKSAHCGDGRTGHAMWARVFGETGNVGFGGSGVAGRVSRFEQHGPSYDYTLGGFQAGMDLYRSQTSNGSENVAGVYVGAGRVTSNVKRAHGGKAGDVSMDGYTFGGYWTHKNVTGWYVDGVTQVTYFGDIKATSVDGQALKSDGWGFEGSVEAGYPIALKEGWVLTPQAQLVYQHLSLDGGQDNYGTVRYQATDSVYGRLGAKISKDWRLSDERVLTTFAHINLWHSFGAEATTGFNSLNGLNPVSLETDLGGSWGQVGFGVSGKLTQNVNVFASGDYNFALGSGRGTSFGGRMGLQVSW